jgi:hypothetical protein
MLRDPTCSSSGGGGGHTNANRARGRPSVSALAAWRGPWSRLDKRWSEELRSAAGMPSEGTAAARGVFYMAMSDFAEAFEKCTIASGN